MGASRIQEKAEGKLGYRQKERNLKLLKKIPEVSYHLHRKKNLEVLLT